MVPLNREASWNTAPISRRSTVTGISSMGSP